MSQQNMLYAEYREYFKDELAHQNIFSVYKISSKPKDHF